MIHVGRMTSHAFLSRQLSIESTFHHDWNGSRSKRSFRHGWTAQTIVLKLPENEEGEEEKEEAEDWWLLDQVRRIIQRYKYTNKAGYAWSLRCSYFKIYVLFISIFFLLSGACIRAGWQSLKEYLPVSYNKSPTSALCER
jgi:hypothetical protein